MSDSLFQNAEQFGALGIIAFAMGYFILYIMKQHKEERAEWRDMAADQHREATTAINNNTAVLSRLEALIPRKFK